MWWNVLGVSREAQGDEIRAAYASLVKSAHPEEHPEEFRKLHEAYQAAMAAVRSRGRSQYQPPSAAPRQSGRPSDSGAHTPNAVQAEPGPNPQTLFAGIAPTPEAPQAEQAPQSQALWQGIPRQQSQRPVESQTAQREGLDTRALFAQIPEPQSHDKEQAVRNEQTELLHDEKKRQEQVAQARAAAEEKHKNETKRRAKLLARVLIGSVCLAFLIFIRISRPNRTQPTHKPETDFSQMMENVQLQNGAWTGDIMQKTQLQSMQILLRSALSAVAAPEGQALQVPAYGTLIKATEACVVVVYDPLQSRTAQAQGLLEAYTSSRLMLTETESSWALYCVIKEDGSISATGMHALSAEHWNALQAEENPAETLALEMENGDFSYLEGKPELMEKPQDASAISAPESEGYASTTPSQSDASTTP